jgi:hypothetical protein
MWCTHTPKAMNPMLMVETTSARYPKMCRRAKHVTNVVMIAVPGRKMM